ncbi:MAG: 16S rRNA (adenine(1518)-N(6)/adenine(1519)-N(6))-dimethyltransferase RsmA [Candidatus Nanopelagicales bacterium]
MLLGPAEIAKLLEELSVKPTKKLGQNFLHDANIVRKIVKAAQLEPDDVVLEVGPGLGSLTLGLLPEVSSVIAVDIDERFIDQLPKTVAKFAPEFKDRLVATHQDALTLTADDLTKAPTALVANLPYNVAVPVIITLLTNFPSIAKLLVMVQAEVADRLAAKPGDSAYGAPSVKLQWFMQVTRGANIPRPVFIPVPNVDSGLVFGIRQQSPKTQVEQRDVFKVIDAAFNQRRKMLRSALTSITTSATEAEAALIKAGIDPTLRGEMLDIEQYVRLTEALN